MSLSSVTSAILPAYTLRVDLLPGPRRTSKLGLRYGIISLFSFNLNSLEFSIEVLGLENWQKNVIKKHAQYQGELEDINQYVKSSNFSLVESNGA